MSKTIEQLRQDELRAQAKLRDALTRLEDAPDHDADAGAEFERAHQAAERARAARVLAEQPSDQGGTMSDTSGLRVEDRDATGQGADVGERITAELRGVARGETRALTTASTLAPGELSSFLFDKLRASSVALASGIQVISTDRDTITFPRLTADVAPGWYSEAAAITPGDPTLDSIVATPRKLAHLTVFSNEVIEDSEPAALDVVRDNMIKAIGLKLDLGIYQGSGTPPEVRGLLQTANIQFVSANSGGDTLADLDKFAKAIGKLEAENATAGAIVMHPRLWTAVRVLKDQHDRYLVGTGSGDAPRTLFGVPVYLSSQLAFDGGSGLTDVYVYDPSQVYLVVRRDVEVELDRSRLFNTDQSELRGRMRADLIVPNPKAVCVIEDVKPAAL